MQEVAVSQGNRKAIRSQLHLVQKIAKYLNLSNRSECDFLPVVFDSTGSMHRDVILLLQLLALSMLLDHVVSPVPLCWPILKSDFLWLFKMLLWDL